jgi:hypothetical protein
MSKTRADLADRQKTAVVSVDDAIGEIHECLLELHGVNDRPMELVPQKSVLGTVEMRAFGYRNAITLVDLDSLDSKLQVIEASCRDAGDNVTLRCHFNGAAVNTAKTLSGCVEVVMEVSRSEKRRDTSK